MSRIRFKKVLLVAPESLPYQLSPDYEKVRHVYAVNQIFPSIFELNPNLIVLDHNYLSNDMEKIVRRIRTNKFYKNIKICCFKTKANTKTDDLLKAIGVDYFIYEEELKSIQKNKSLTAAFNKISDMAALSMLPTPSSN
jgi:CheY-like chemotaxis protein